MRGRSRGRRQGPVCVSPPFVDGLKEGVVPCGGVYFKTPDRGEKREEDGMEVCVAELEHEVCDTVWAGAFVGGLGLERCDNFL